MDNQTPDETSRQHQKPNTESPKLPDHPAFEAVPQKQHGHKLIYAYLLLLVVAAIAGLVGYFYHRYE